MFINIIVNRNTYSNKGIFSYLDKNDFMEVKLLNPSQKLDTNNRYYVQNMIDNCLSTTIVSLINLMEANSVSKYFIINHDEVEKLDISDLEVLYGLENDRYNIIRLNCLNNDFEISSMLRENYVHYIDLERNIRLISSKGVYIDSSAFLINGKIDLSMLKIDFNHTISHLDTINKLKVFCAYNIKSKFKSKIDNIISENKYLRTNNKILNAIIGIIVTSFFIMSFRKK